MAGGCRLSHIHCYNSTAQKVRVLCNTAGCSNSLFLCELQKSQCAGACPAWWHTWWPVTTNSTVCMRWKTKWINWSEGWYAAGERPALIIRNKNAHLQTSSHQKSVHNKHLSAEEEKGFNTSFQESRKGAEQQQDMCHLTVYPRLSALRLEILPSLLSRIKFPAWRLLLLLFNVFSLLKEKNLSTTKFAVDFWRGSASLSQLESLLNYFGLSKYRQ